MGSGRHPNDEENDQPSFELGRGVFILMVSGSLIVLSSVVEGHGGIADAQPPNQ